jgi:hypothetical protein
MVNSFAAYKYDRKAGMPLRLPQLVVLSVITLAFVAFDWPLLPAVPILAVVVLVWGFVTAPSMRRKIIITNRFIIVADKVVYFQSIKKVQVTPERCVIHSKQESCTIEADLFPTNARKDWKIARNKKAKLEKVVDKLKSVFPTEALPGIFE